MALIVALKVSEVSFRQPEVRRLWRYVRDTDISFGGYPSRLRLDYHVQDLTTFRQGESKRVRASFVK